MSPAAAPCMQRNRDRRQWAGGAGSAANGRRLRRAAAAAGQQGNPLDLEPTLVLAGFYIEEIAGVRQLLDEIGAAEVKVVPTTPERLHRPLRQVLATPEPRWDQPVPGDWEAGGGWGQLPTVLMAGLDQQGANILLDLLEESLGASVCPAFATPENMGAPLGEVLAAGLKLWRQSGGSTSAGGGAAAGSAPSEAAGGIAADAAPGSDAAEEGVQFTQELPPLEQLLSQPAGQAARAAEGSSASTAEAGGSNGGSGGSAASNATAASPTASSSSVTKARQVGTSLAPEVVQAEFSERPAASAAAATEEEGEEGVPLDLIDAIATGSEPQGPPLAAATAAPPAAPAAPAVRAEEGAEVDSMSREEVLAAARAALGLDSADLQRLVDEAAAKAAAATGVPFVPGSAAGSIDSVAGSSDSVAGSSGSGFPGASPEAAVPAAAAARAPAPAVRPAPPSSSGSSSPKPWEVAAPPAARPGSKGFGRPAPPSRKAAKAASRRPAGGSSGAAGQPAAAAQAAPASSQSEAAGARQRPVQEKQQQGEQPADEERVLPPADQFVLSRAQLREVTEQHGLNYEELLAGLKQRGIELSD